MFLFHIALLLCLQRISARVIDDYNQTRFNILNQEIKNTIGGDIELTDDEKLVNNVLMNLKKKEVDEAFYHPEKFNLSKHYFNYKDYIEKSEVYQLVKQMPKGAALHVHRTFMQNADFLLKLTYEDNLFICYVDETMQFRFSDDVPDLPCANKWILVKELRDSADDVEAFDSELRKHLTIVPVNKEDITSDLTTAWKRFGQIHNVIKTLTFYRPVQEKCIYEILKTLHRDNVMYAEIRNGIQHLYELNGTEHDEMYTMRLYREITDKFKLDHPDFVGVKIIITKARFGPIARVNETIKITKRLKKVFPDFIAGFDIVGQEDAGRPLTDYLPLLLASKSELDYFFHAGETNWFGTVSDENLVDAILLGSKRIGHGYALAKHPLLLSMVKQQNIAIEVNVISNGVLALVSDVRNHPLATFMASGVPIVLSSDDYGVWESEPLSHDFYIVFVAVASRHSDLRLLKQLALNSIKYSALKEDERTTFYNVFNKRWDKFISDVLLKYQDSDCILSG